MTDAVDMLTDKIITLQTALATVQELHDIAIQQRDQVTKELEEAKRLNLSLALSKDVTFVTPQMQPSEEASILREMMHTLRTDYARLEVNHRDLYARSQQQLATARAEALREAISAIHDVAAGKVGCCNSALVDAAEALTALRGDA